MFAGAGVVAVFVSENQAGSVTLVVIGALFLLMAVSGRTIESVRIGDWEFTMSELRRQAAEQAHSGLTDQAQALLNVLKRLDPAADRDPAVHAVEITVFENRVLDAVETARAEGEQVERHPDSGLGEPLAVLVAQPDGVRIGTFAAYAPDDSGHISATSSDSFVRRAREVDCAAYLFVNGTLHQDDLARLAEGIQRDSGRPVGVETWTSTTQPAPLRPAIDGLLARVRGPQDERVTIPGQ
ncbi:hypothetical protein [Streptomyces fuscichromogenes]|uniref:Uncharacterized protein n=1 Tax=Streptomyces fuscichromogenes TaxID=1324013 RepID=A0A918CWQ9_9ACTN|nr:hypothetical protein [Streptomyces fuscichromogenes]GGN40185.1 hypothetical protein GCM10011578_087450 [Streptomyces fuscichromogenes]